MPTRIADAELVALVEASPSLDALRDGLGERGITLDRRICRRLAKAWKRAKLTEGHPETIDEDVLPCSVVQAGGVEYRIHGILHGQRRVLKIGDDVRTTIHDLVIGWDDPPRSGVALERGLAKMLGVSEAYDLRYTEAFLRRVGLRGIARMLLILPLLPIAPIVVRFTRDPFDRPIRTAMSDLGASRRLRALYLRCELPGRIAFDLDRVSLNRVRVAHSEAQAEAAIERAESQGVKTMHLVVGLAHENDLVFLLSDQEGRSTPTHHS
jgi:hypothetical protein